MANNVHRSFQLRKEHEPTTTNPWWGVWGLNLAAVIPLNPFILLQSSAVITLLWYPWTGVGWEVRDHSQVNAEAHIAPETLMRLHRIQLRTEFVPISLLKKLVKNTIYCFKWFYFKSIQMLFKKHLKLIHYFQKHFHCFHSSVWLVLPVPPRRYFYLSFIFTSVCFSFLP